MFFVLFLTDLITLWSWDRDVILLNFPMGHLITAFFIETSPDIMIILSWIALTRHPGTKTQAKLYEM